MSDLGSQYTDKKIKEVEARIRSVYFEAARDMEAKLKEFNEKYEAKYQIHLQELKDEKITQADFDAWVQGQIFQGNQWKAKRDQLIKIMQNANQVAVNIVNNNMYSVFAFNGNYQAYQIEQGFGVSFGFELYDTATVSNLVQNDPQILPKWKINEEKDYIWNYKKVNNAVTQGIIQGERLDQISSRLTKSLCAQNENTMKTFARTGMTQAQNAGRLERQKQAKKMGINIKKEWMATLDGRTRHSHRHLDGEKVDEDEKFSNGCRYPGDPEGPAWEVYNCRCTLVADLVDYPAEYERYDNIDGKPIKNMTYKEWEKAKTSKSSVANSIINGKDISATWQRRPDQFDFEIEDVINAQGFDGLPRVVSAEEFDELVKQANGGNGFIAQRTYSAPDQETLDAYREQLYYGKWYVDCSTGGAQYGQGMYCAADYTGTLTDGIKTEMKHYQSLGDSRLGSVAKSYIETLTLDPSAKIVSYKDLEREFNSWKLDAGARAQRSIIESYSEKGQDFITFLQYNSVDGGIKFLDAQKAYESLSQEDKDLIDKIITKMNEAWRKADTEIASMDIGSYATIKGYDAINAEGHGASDSYTVILNRTKCIFKGE